MRVQVTEAPPNSMFFLSGRMETEFLNTDPRLLEPGAPEIWSKPTIISVGCLCFVDGETSLTITDEPGWPDIAPSFDGMLETPDRIFLVSTSEREILLTAQVPEKETRVRIWTNDRVEPEEILIHLN